VAEDRTGDDVVSELCGALPWALPDEAALRLDHLLYQRSLPDLRHLRTFNEKMLMRKQYERDA